MAAYPELHPESPTLESELLHFKTKVDAGANGAITQYFYASDAYFRFRDECLAQGIDIPITPGIMPITNLAGIKRFSAVCGADIPRWILRRLESLENDSDSLKAFGEEVVTSLCEQLIQGGVPGLHFYTLNQSNQPCVSAKTLGTEQHIPRIFIDQPLSVGQTLDLPTDKTHHLIGVLRLRDDDAVMLFNGTEEEFGARLKVMDKRRVLATIVSAESPCRESSLSITLWLGVCKRDAMAAAYDARRSSGFRHSASVD